eukprot:1487286-Prymnesium_polylepis.3
MRGTQQRLQGAARCGCHARSFRHVGGEDALRVALRVCSWRLPTAIHSQPPVGARRRPGCRGGHARGLV